VIQTLPFQAFDFLLLGFLAISSPFLGHQPSSLARFMPWKFYRPNAERTTALLELELQRLTRTW
jgi:hypothetical protein